MFLLWNTAGNFNSRPHGGRQYFSFHCRMRRYFNSRPHGGRLIRPHVEVVFLYFNSRPHGGRPKDIHMSVRKIYFNSRPHGGRLGFTVNSSTEYLFQLTPSRRATSKDFYAISRIGISTHALTEGDRQFGFFFLNSFHFNSRPHGGRRQI